MRWSSLSLLFVMLISAACESDFSPGSRVTKLRLLALAADSPFAEPEQRVTLRPLLAAPEPAQVRWAYATCTDPAASSIDACLSALDAPFQAFDPEPDGLTLQLKAADAYTQTRQLGVLVVVCPGDIEPGSTGLVPVVCRDPAGEVLGLHQFELGMKRIFVRERDRNQNPSIEALTWDGEAWPQDEVKHAEVCAESGHDIDDCPTALRHKLGIATSPPERGQDEAGRDFEEQQVVQVYATHGVFEYQVRLAGAANLTDNAWVAQRRERGGEAASGPDDLATLWFVVRDDRGGVSWQTRRVALR